MATTDELRREYLRLAHRADTRLARLEKYAEREHFRGIKTYAYARAMSDIQAFEGGEGLTRFRANVPNTPEALRARINAVNTFLESPTSTISSVRGVYMKRTAAYNQSQGTNFTWQEMANFWEFNEDNRLDEKYGSRTLARALARVKKLTRRTESNSISIEEALEMNQHLEGSGVVRQVTSQLLKSGLTYEDLFADKE